MTDEKKGSPQPPTAASSRGGSGPQWETRCIDCLPFTILDGRVDSLEHRTARIESKVQSIDGNIERLSFDVRKVLKFIDGNGQPERGFSHRLLDLEKDYRRTSTVASRLTWLIVGILTSAFVASLLGLVGKVLLDAARRGALG